MSFGELEYRCLLCNEEKAPQVLFIFNMLINVVQGESMN
jgi:hypothetical protein